MPTQRKHWDEIVPWGRQSWVSFEHGFNFKCFYLFLLAIFANFCSNVFFFLLCFSPWRCWYNHFFRSWKSILNLPIYLVTKKCFVFANQQNVLIWSSFPHKREITHSSIWVLHFQQYSLSFHGLCQKFLATNTQKKCNRNKPMLNKLFVRVFIHHTREKKTFRKWIKKIR